MKSSRSNLKKVFISLGSNLGNRDAYLRDAIKLISAHPEVNLVSSSRVMETSPIGPIKQDDYLNQILMILTVISPSDLLKFLKLIEIKLGRKKRKRWAQREIDIDIIAYQDAITRTPQLWIPHKEITNRLFVLEGLYELDPNYIIEGGKESVAALYRTNFPKLKGQSVKFI